MMLIFWIFYILNIAFCQNDSPKLLLVNKRDVRLISLQGSKNTEILASKLKQAIACDYIFSDGLVFWIDAVDYTKGKIQCTNMSDSGYSVSDVIGYGMEQPDGLACDWIGRKIYWTDAETKRIEVSEIDGSSRKIIVWGHLDQPRAIAVDPHRAYMYWTDWGEIAKIERSGMDGSNRRVLVNDGIYWPNGITLDYEEQKVYWVEAYYHTIYRMNMDGSNRQEVINGDTIRLAFLSGSILSSSSPPFANISEPKPPNTVLSHNPPLGALQHPFAITVYAERLYWSDWATDSIHSMMKNGTGIPNVIASENVSPMDIQIYSSHRQKPGDNPCGDNNGGCSHLCLLSPDPPHYRCACPTGVRIETDNKTCPAGPTNFLLLARRSDIRMISLDTTDYSDILIPVGDVQEAIAVDFDPVEKFVYWTDNGHKKIYRTSLNDSDVKPIVTSDVEQSDGIAIDWVARNLYWTDTGRNYISVSRLNGEMRKILIETGIDEPREIAVDPGVGRMYWSDWGVNAKIEAADLDGGNRKTLVDTDIEWPNGLALDRSNKLLYWADARKDRIEVIRLDGTGRSIVFSDELPHVFGLSLLDNYLYWTDRQRRRIERMCVNCHLPRELIEELPDVFGVTAASLSIPPVTNPCAIANGGCSHLCLFTPQGPNCHCPSGMELSPSLKDCFIPEAFLLISFSKAGGIRKIPLDTARSNSQIPFPFQIQASFLDFHVLNSQIYWSDTANKVIMRAFMNGTNVQRFLGTGFEMLEEIAVDWIGQNLYWADSTSNRIEMIGLNGKSRKLILYKNIAEPRSLALDPENGYIYWSEWSTDPCIQRADLNGENVVQVNQGTIGRADSLTIDHQAQKLYYVDIDLNNIVSSDMNGENLTDVVIGGGTKSISSLTLYGEYVYWSDSKRHAVMRAKKADGKNEEVIQENLDNIDYIVIYHASRQEGVTACADNNGDCEHLCISLPQGTSTCACPTHYTLNSDNRTCTAPSNFLLLSQSSYLSQIIFKYSNDEEAVVPQRGRSNYRSRKYRFRASPDAPLPIPGIQNACSIDYDSITGTIFWIDCKQALIKSAKPDGSEVRVVFRNNDTSYQPYDLTVDSYSKFIYWTETTTNTIRLMKFDGTPIGIVLKGRVREIGRKDIEIHPRKIAVDPRRGRLYFSNTCDNSNSCRVKIMQSALDGSECIVFFSRELRNVTALVLDSQDEKLYWADQTKIEMSNLDGSSRETIVDTGLVMVVGLAVFGSDLFWIDSTTNGGMLEGADKSDGSDRRRIQSRMKFLSDIVGVISSDDKRYANYPCSVDNGGCSHICVTSENQSTRCSCPSHLVLVDSLNCVKPSTCTQNQFTCKKQPQCIPLTWVCDGDAECDDKTDELDCANKIIPRPCRGRFSCGTSNLDSSNIIIKSIPQCIDYDSVCDNKIDCLNGKDEQNCSKCKPGEISCGSSYCTVASIPCNDCPNGACLPNTPNNFNSSKSYVVPLAVIGSVVGILAIALILKYCLAHNNHPFGGVVMFTPNEHGHFKVEFQSHPPNAAKTSNRKSPFLVSIVPPTAPNSTTSQTGTSRSGWPTHKDGRLADRPKLSGASCSSTFNRSDESSCPTALHSCAHDYCSSSDTNSFHESCSACRRSQRHRRYRKPALNGAPPPTPCTTDTCEDFEKFSYRSADSKAFPHEPPPPYSQHHSCCHRCYHQCNRCYTSSSVGSSSSRCHGNGNPPSYDRLRNSRRRHYQRPFGDVNSDLDLYPPPPTPRSQYMSECCDTTEVEDSHEPETITTSRIEESDREDDEETVLLAPSRRGSPSPTDVSFTPFNPPPSPVSSR